MDYMLEKLIIDKEPNISRLYKDLNSIKKFLYIPIIFASAVALNEISNANIEKAGYALFTSLFCFGASKYTSYVKKKVIDSGYYQGKLNTKEVSLN